MKRDPRSLVALFGIFLVLNGCAPARARPPEARRPDATTTVFVVRHAERASETDPDPRLSQAGYLRARALSDALADAGVEVVVTTQYVRTRETALPLAERLGLGISLDSVKNAEASSRELARRVLTEHAGQTVLIVGHSNTVPLIVRALGGADVGALADSDYDNLFTVIVRPAGDVSTIRGRFGAPD